MRHSDDSRRLRGRRMGYREAGPWGRHKMVHTANEAEEQYEERER